MKNIKNKTRGSIILRVVMYGYKTWSVTLQEENRQRAYENRVMRKLFWTKRGRVTKDL